MPLSLSRPCRLWDSAVPTATYQLGAPWSLGLCSLALSVQWECCCSCRVGGVEPVARGLLECSWDGGLHPQAPGIVQDAASPRTAGSGVQWASSFFCHLSRGMDGLPDGMLWAQPQCSARIAIFQWCWERATQATGAIVQHLEPPKPCRSRTPVWRWNRRSLIDNLYPFSPPPLDASWEMRSGCVCPGCGNQVTPPPTALAPISDPASLTPTLLTAWGGSKESKHGLDWVPA